MSSLEGGPWDAGTGAGDPLDCAIVGGGVSGLYAGWRLARDAGLRRVAVFEWGDRTGGRLLTWLPFGANAGLRAELGGMRFFRQQELVWNLIGHLGLRTTPFFTTGPHLLWYLRGRRLPAGAADAAAARYALNQAERGLEPDALIRHVVATVLGTPENRAVIRDRLGKSAPETRADWDGIKQALRYRGRPLWDVGFWNVISDVLSYEGYNYTTDAFGYYSVTSNWNAAEAMQSVSLDFTQNPEYATLVEGYSQLPDTLRAGFEGAGGAVHLRHRVLRLDAGAGDGFTLQVDGAGQVREVAARRVILALPRRAIDLLAPSALFDARVDGRLAALIESVTPYPALKLFLLYAERWWETSIGIEHGRSICDLPIRQTYYFRPDGCERPGAACAPYGLLMASYDDAQAVGYWKGMELPAADRATSRDTLRRVLEAVTASLFSGHGVASAADAAAAGPAFDPPPNLHLAPPEMVRRATEQLAILHGLSVEDIPDPLVGAYADWSLDPHGGGWNFWQPQVDVRATMQEVRTPLGPDRGLYIVGDAYSGLQGWVEGALTTTERVLQDRFGLPRPAWLPTGYYLGW